MAEIEAGNLYDINKQLIAKYEKAFSKADISKAMTEIVKPYLKEKIRNDKYFMLLCHEDRNYTVFSIDNFPKAIEKSTQILKECLLNRGKIFGIDPTQDGVALEIWIKDPNKKELFCYYFFPYSDAVIEIKEVN